MENAKKEIDKSIEILKEDLQKNFNKDCYERINDSASYLLQRSIEINYLKGQYGALNLLGNASFNICDYEKAQGYFLESINIAEKMKDNKSIAFGLNNIGIIFFRLKQFEKALEYYEKALEIKMKFDDKSSISTAYNNIGLVYSNIKEYDKALNYFKMSLKIDDEICNKYALCRELNNIGLVWKYKGNLKKSLKYFEESYSVSKEAEFNKGMASALSNIANHHLSTENLDTALEKALEGEKIAIAIHSNNHLIHFYSTISEVYEKKEDFVNALIYFKKNYALKDNFISEESHKKIFEMQIKYESEKKEKESELYRMKTEELSVLNAAKDKFFRIIHHDMLNPLTAIHSTAGFLDEFYENFDDKKRKNYIKMILSSSERLLKLMDNLFEWVKTQSGEIDYKPEKVDLKEIANHNLELFANNINSKEIITELKFPKNCFANADRNMVDTIIRNLIANAIKFTYNKGMIKIYAKSIYDKIRLTVEDNGIGIEKIYINKLFIVSESFTLPGTNDEKGTGLGLILVKEFLDINKGRIFIKSESGKGSKFTIELPKYI
ncbi:MAG: tetratricopeptide repeat-containing sensor histidine kinase [Candidatus Delongbacteria bacterium]|nr:tetratricopeptide repeat-containing sensor histidine kinase [Candidatus Delongbacteria bacterium]MCG2760486.1 tetratricopeptide repeat-containing sensor histidine kinase [Candidatus Delongbacteria bacterium]